MTLYRILFVNDGRVEERLFKNKEDYDNLVRTILLANAGEEDVTIIKEVNPYTNQELGIRFTLDNYNYIECGMVRLV